MFYDHLTLLFACHGKWEISEAPAGKEDPVKHQKGKKTLVCNSTESRTCCMPVEKDSVVHQQGKKTLLSLSLVLYRDIGCVALVGVAACN